MLERIESQAFMADMPGVILGPVATVGENVIHLRKQRRMSQKTLAQRLGVSQPRVWQIEKGTSMTGAMELSTLMQLAKALDCSIEDLIAGIDTSYDDVAKRNRVGPTTTPSKKADHPRVGRVSSVLHTDLPARSGVKEGTVAHASSAASLDRGDPETERLYKKVRARVDAAIRQDVVLDQLLESASTVLTIAEALKADAAAARDGAEESEAPERDTAHRQRRRAGRR